MSLLDVARLYVGFWLIVTPSVIAFDVWRKWESSKGYGGSSYHWFDAIVAFLKCFGLAVGLPILSLAISFALGLA